MYSHDHSFLQLCSPGIFWSNRWVGPSRVVAIHRVAWRRDSWWDPPMVEVRWQHMCMAHQPNADRGISKLTILISVRRNWVTATSLHTLKECLSSSLPLIAWAAHKQSWLQWEVTSSSVTTVCVDLKMYRLSNRSVTYPISYKKCTTTTCGWSSIKVLYRPVGWKMHQSNRSLQQARTLRPTSTCIELIGANRFCSWPNLRTPQKRIWFIV